MNEVEETLIIIKPDGIKYYEEIISMFYSNDLKIKEYKITRLD